MASFALSWSATDNPVGQGSALPAGVVFDKLALDEEVVATSLVEVGGGAVLVDSVTVDGAAVDAIEPAAVSREPAADDRPGASAEATAVEVAPAEVAPAVVVSAGNSVATMLPCGVRSLIGVEIDVGALPLVQPATPASRTTSTTNRPNLLLEFTPTPRSLPTIEPTLASERQNRAIWKSIVDNLRFNPFPRMQTSIGEPHAETARYKADRDQCVARSGRQLLVPAILFSTALA